MEGGGRHFLLLNKQASITPTTVQETNFCSGAVFVKGGLRLHQIMSASPASQHLMIWMLLLMILYLPTYRLQADDYTDSPPRIVAHFHEWMAGVGLIMSRSVSVLSSTKKIHIRWEKKKTSFRVSQKFLLDFVRFCKVQFFFFPLIS